ncbi:serine/threonine-protein kinase [Picosynechococcus sp. PCC 11901]|uniref:serine/threonine-protein kinase n=1 Tax=Picosynechococcus sp. PCC 11901 TaxID=2579791 RepID=UPI00210740FB|nr:serine/threonine-protein kinase [Picosynechococcus sp. PCC 11901]
MTASLLAPGHTLRGRYHILRSLAQGGFGATFLAEDRDRPKRPICVVKLLKPQTTDAETLATARRLFETEAKILDELGQHPQIPQLLAYFEEGQEFYLVEEYIEGQSLWEELQQLSPCPPAGAIALVQEILELLVFVHEHQVIHRDLNPSNLIRRQADQKLCLIDFGAVKQVTHQFATTSGRPTIAIGTQGYMPLEQIQGYPRYCSDLYAAGMIAITALTGTAPDKIPLDAQTGEVQWQDQVEISAEVRHFLSKMVHHNWRDRFGTATEAQQALLPLAAQGTQSPQTSTRVLSPVTGSIQHIKQTAIAPLNYLSTVVSQQYQRLSVNHQAIKAALLGVGLAALVGTGLGVHAGWRWWSERQALMAQYEQAQLSQSQNQLEQALAQYQEILQTVPDHEGALLGKAQVLQALERFDAALGAYDQLLEVNPRRWEAWWSKGKIASDRQQDDQALTFLDRAIQEDARQAVVWETKARLHLRREETDAALSSLDAFLRLDSQQVWAWFEKGWIHHNRAEYNAAIAAYQQALKLDDRNADIWYQQGNSYSKLQRYRDAKNAYVRVVELEPDRAPAWYSLGMAQENLRNYTEAQDAFANVTRLEPNNDRAWYHLAWNAEQNGDRPTAIDAYQRVVALNSDDRPSWRSLGNLLYDSENYTEAIAAYENTLRLDDADGDIWARLGNAYKATGQYQTAINAYDEALQYKPNDPDILGDRQDAQERLQWEQAQDDFKEGADSLKKVLRDTLREIVPWL